jgi:hypothetical protein
MPDAPRFTLIGGPTLLLELEGFRLLTDPTFAPPGDYPGPVHLEKRTGPAVAPGAQVIAVHDEGWAHYTEGESDLRQAFAALGQAERLWPLERGRPWAWPSPREMGAPGAPAAGP